MRLVSRAHDRPPFYWASAAYGDGDEMLEVVSTHTTAGGKMGVGRDRLGGPGPSTSRQSSRFAHLGLSLDLPAKTTETGGPRTTIWTISEENGESTESSESSSEDDRVFIRASSASAIHRLNVPRPPIKRHRSVQAPPSPTSPQRSSSFTTIAT